MESDLSLLTRPELIERLAPLPVEVEDADELLYENAEQAEPVVALSPLDPRRQFVDRRTASGVLGQLPPQTPGTQWGGRMMLLAAAGFPDEGAFAHLL